MYVSNGWLETGGWSLHTGNHDSFFFYQANGSSGYAIHTTDQNGWIGYDNSSDTLTLSTLPPSPNNVILTNWSISPAPPQQYTSSLVAPSTPGAPAAGKFFAFLSLLMMV